MSRTGSGGNHVYFSLPPSLESCPSGMLYGLWDTWGDDGKGRWAKHREVRILGDQSLVIAPPSIHVETGRPYAFDPHAGPRNIPFPAEDPAWLLALPRLEKPRFGEPPRAPAPRRPAATSGAFYTRDEVLAAMGERKLAVAKDWGLVTARDHPNPSGWVP